MVVMRSSPCTPTALTAPLIDHNGSDSGVCSSGAKAISDDTVARAVLVSQPKSHPFQDRYLSLQKPQKIGRAVSPRTATTNALFDCKVLSRNHALLWFENGKFYLKDTNSSNGTYVNEERLGNNNEESLPCEVSSGDIVKFGVDVIENSKNVTHGCVMAQLKLYLPGGKEAQSGRHAPSLLSGSVVTVQLSTIYTLRQRLQEAVKREEALVQKLAALQQLLDSCKLAVDSSWSAMVDEDHLMTRLETLEAQNALFFKKFGEDKSREEVVNLMEEKEGYQNAAKESIRRVILEKYTAINNLKEMEQRINSLESDRQLEEQLRRVADESLVQLSEKHEQLMSEMADKLRAAENNSSCEKELQKQLSCVSELRQQNSHLQQQLNNCCSVDEESDGEVEDMVEDSESDEIVVPAAIHSWTSSLISRLSETRKQQQNLTGLISDLNDSLAKSEEDVRTKCMDISELEAMIRDSECELAELKKAMRQHEDKLIDFQSASKSESVSSGGDEGDNKSISDDNKVLDTLKDGLSNTLNLHAECEARVERLGAQLLEVRATVANAEQKSASLQTQINERNAQLKSVSGRVARLQRHVLAAERCEKQLKQRFDRFHQQLSSAELSIVAKDRLLESFTERAECAERHLSEVSSAKEAVSEENDRLSQQLQQTNRQLLECQERLDRANQQHSLVSVGTMTDGEVSICRCAASSCLVSTSFHSPANHVRATPVKTPVSSPPSAKTSIDVFSSYSTLALVVLVISLFVAFLLMNTQ